MVVIIITADPSIQFQDTKIYTLLSAFFYKCMTTTNSQYVIFEYKSALKK